VPFNLDVFERAPVAVACLVISEAVRVIRLLIDQARDPLLTFARELPEKIPGLG
jgi:hypothetical protein